MRIVVILIIFLLFVFVLVCLGCHIEYHRLNSSNKRYSFLIFLEAGKSNMKVPAKSVSITDEDSWLEDGHIPTDREKGRENEHMSKYWSLFL